MFNSLQNNANMLLSKLHKKIQYVNVFSTHTRNSVCLDKKGRQYDIEK